MAPLYKITITEERPAKVSQRRWREINRRAFLTAGQMWHAEMLPEHFKRDARTKYNHQPRKERYLRRKQFLGRTGRVKYGGQVDNVFTGLLEETVRRFAEIRAFPSRASLRMAGTRYMTLRPRGAQPDKMAELKTVTAQEQRTIAERMEKQVADELNRLRAPKKTRV